ncbi:MAG: RNA 2',3'-cyclic phosphodiesterase [Chloroflexota bacterium]
MTDSSRRPRWPGADLPGRRVFIATPLPDTAMESIAGVVEEVRAAGVQGDGRDVRWVRLDGLHLTLRFLGPTLEDRIEAARDAVRVAGASAEPFDLVIGGAGTFPPVGRPRAIWLGVRDGAERLGELAALVDRSLVGAGWPSETRPYRAHLTLARADGVPAGIAIGARLAAAAADLRIPARIDRIGLFESLTGGGPARYEPLELVELGGAPQSG